VFHGGTVEHTERVEHVFLLVPLFLVSRFFTTEQEEFEKEGGTGRNERQCRSHYKWRLSSNTRMNSGDSAGQILVGDVFEAGLLHHSDKVLLVGKF
jgi:hypothetical protein